MLDLINRQRFAVEIFFEQRVILLGDMLKHLVVIGLRKLLHIRGDLRHFDIHAEIVLIIVRLHGDKVNDALELRLRADGQLDGHGVAFQTILHHCDHAEKISAHNVHFVDIDHSGNMILIRLAPNGFGLGLHAAFCAKDGHGTVEHAQAALHLYGEIDVARRVDDVDAVALPEAGGRSRRDGDAALLLLLHPVHGGSAVVGFTDLVRFPRIEQDAFGCRCFTGVDVCHDADISGHFQGYLSGHKNLRVRKT